MKPVKSGVRAYIAPVNHNSINTSRVASIISTMLDNYCQDTNNDITHLLDMGVDAGVLFGYINRVRIHIVHTQQYIQILDIFFHVHIQQYIQIQNILFPNIVYLCTNALFTKEETT